MGRGVRRISLAAVAFLAVACALGLLSASTQVTQTPSIIQTPSPTPSPADETGSEQPKKLREIRIDSIEDQQVNSQGAVVLDSLYEGGRLHAELSGDAALGDDEDLWLLAKPQDAQAYQVFGPAQVLQQEGRFVWGISDVALAYPGLGQGKYFFFRAVVAPKYRKPDATVNSLDGFSLTSWPPVTVVVLKWVLKTGGLSINKIGGRLVESKDPVMYVDDSADVSGSQKESGRGKVYLILHPVNSSVWRAVGPAEVDGERWLCRGVPFAEPGQRNWRQVDVFAVASSEPLRPGPIDYTAHVRQMLAASYSVRVSLVEDTNAPQVEFTRYVTADGHAQEIGTGPETLVKLKDVEFSLQGTVKELPPGKLLRVLFNPVGTPLWVVSDGAALVSGAEWSLPRLHLESPGGGPTKRFRLVMAVADAALQVGVVSYATWQSKSVAVSPILIIEVEQEDGGQPPPSSEITLSIVRVKGVEVGSENSVKVSDHGPVEVRASGVSQGAQVWLGENHAGQDIWRFVPAVRSSEETWIVQNLLFGEDLPRPDSVDGDSLEEGDLLTAIVTRTSLPAHESDSASWPLYAQAVSPQVSVTHAPGTTPKQSSFLTPTSWLWLLVGAAVLLFATPIVKRRWELSERLRAGGGAGGAGNGGEMASVDTPDQTLGAPRPPSAGPSAQLSVRPSARPTPASLWWVLGFVLILALAAVLGYAFLYILLPLLFLAVLVKSGNKSEAVSRVAGEVKKASEETFTYFRGTFTYVQGKKRGRPNLYARRSALGMLLLGLGIFAITGYLPIYEHILRNSLRLSGSQSHSLAMLLIIFIALTGVVADVTVRYGRGEKREAADGDEEYAPHDSDDGSSREQQSTQNSGGFGYALRATLVMLIAGALMFFQSILYFEFYKTQAAEGSQLPFALGAAAIFFAAIELLNFYWASRFALDFITWFFIHVVLLAPPALLAKVAALAEQGDSQTLRTRPEEDEPRGPTGP